VISLLIAEYATFRRLIKLCYGTTFIKEGGRDLGVSELVRLIHVANAFECMYAVQECTAALANRDLDLEGAVQCIELTDMLKDVEGMAGLAKKVGVVLAKEVGPVHELFVPSDEKGKPGVLGGLKLSEKVKVKTPTIYYLESLWERGRGFLQALPTRRHVRHRLKSGYIDLVTTPDRYCLFCIAGLLSHGLRGPPIFQGSSAQDGE
jgi:hypothetical protein